MHLPADTPLRHHALTLAALLLLTVVTVLASALDLGAASLPVALAIATLKAALVVAIFMHLRGGPSGPGLVAGAIVVWLVLLVGLTMADYVTRGG